MKLLKILWVALTIFIVLTWVLWFFEIDIRDIKKEIPQILSLPSQEVYAQDLKQTSSPLVSSCMESFNECKSISQKKYDTSISIIKTEEFDYYDEADDFYRTWSNGLITLEALLTIDGRYNFMTKEDALPIVLVAAKIKAEDNSSPVVFVCDNSGELIKISKQSMGC